MRMEGGAIVEVIAFFDTIEFTDFWNHPHLPVTP
jgi:hypothetical protein